MKGLVLSLGFFIFLVFLTVFMLRRYRGKKYLRVFLLAFAITLGIYTLVYNFSPGPGAAVDFWNGILFLFLLFHCFADVSYTTVLTGFSTNLLVHIAKRGPLSTRDMEDIYGLTQGRDPVTDWRMDHLVRGKYVLSSRDGYQMLPKGSSVARLAEFLQRLFNTGDGG